MRAFVAAALLCLAAQGVQGEEKAGDRKLLQQELDPAYAILNHLTAATGRLVSYPTPSPSPPPATTAAPVASTKAPAATTAAPATTKAPAASTAAPVATTAAPSPTTPAPTTPPNYLPVNISLTQASTDDPAIIQLGAQSRLPSPTFPNLGPNAVRYVVIGDWGRTAATASTGLPQCSTATYGGGLTDVQGGLQQAQVAELADQVCGLVGGCSFVVSTGDNFYECGIYPNDTTNRFTSDWNNIYNTPKTPNLNGLTWYTTFGNHDIVINGSVEAEIAYTTTNPKWQLPSNYFYVDVPVPAGAPTIRAFFVDANPFIASYNVAGQKYNQAYFQAHVNAAYINAQNAWLQANLAASTATYNIVTGHYPLYGSATQYGHDITTAATSPYPGNFNGWAMLLQTLYANKAAVYYNGHDHTMTVGNPAQAGSPQTWNNYTSFLTSGAGSVGSTTDSCGSPGSFFYSGGGEAGFILVTANATVMQNDYFVAGSLYSQCTVTTYADKTKAPTYSANCALGRPNACCNTPGQAGCY